MSDTQYRVVMEIMGAAHEVYCAHLDTASLIATVVIKNPLVNRVEVQEGQKRLFGHAKPKRST